MGKLSTVAAILIACSGITAAAEPPSRDPDEPFDAASRPATRPSDEVVTSDGTVTVGGVRIDYAAQTGVLVVHSKAWDDAPSPTEGNEPEDDASDVKPTSHDDKVEQRALATMSFVAYLKKGVPPERRPIVFLYNGGPGSSTVWLHMGAFGPRRVVTLDDTHTPGPPYRLVDNEQSLLDVADLVFIDAPGTGFGRLYGRDREKAFWGVDQDASAFADFIIRFLSRAGRWNSPRYLFGESYGTTRSAVLANLLETDRSIDLDGVILLSQILNFDLSADGAEQNPGIDLPYVLALPSYAATAWYHHRLPDPHSDLPSLLDEVERFATGPYAQALMQGSALDDRTRDEIADRLHAYTGLDRDLLLRAHLRIEGGVFEHDLLSGTDRTTGRLDSRFAGPTMDPLAKEADYDPQSAAISSAYVSTFNDYVRSTLHFGTGRSYRDVVDVDKVWDFRHQPPGASRPLSQSTNVMPDLASAMKQNPALHVMLNAGYFDLATPFFEGIYEMRHLPMPHVLQSNIEYRQYMSGHMVYAHTSALVQLHEAVAEFIRGSAGPALAPSRTTSPPIPPGAR